MPGDRCYTVDVDGQPVTVRGRRPPSERDRAMLAELSRAVRAKAEEEDAADRAAGRPTRGERQQARLERFRRR